MLSDWEGGDGFGHQGLMLLKKGEMGYAIKD